MDNDPSSNNPGGSGPNGIRIPPSAVNPFSQLDQSTINSILANPKLTPATLAKYLDPSWIASPHLMYVSVKVAMAIKRGGGRIIVSVPPRHGKSRLLSIGTSTWVLENFPEKQVILASYGADLSEDFSAKVRDQIQNNPDKLSVRIRSDSNRVDRFVTTRGGGMVAVGLGGTITGRGADVLFIDDYIKEIKEAESATYRNGMWKWFVTTAMTRLEPGATVVIIATRWHSDDLIGRILKYFRHKWEYIQLPAEAVENDPLGRKPGEALFPERYPKERLYEYKDLLGSHYYSAVFQQDPESDESRLANKAWIQRTSSLPHLSRLIWGRFWDLAATDDGGDWTNGMLAAADKEARLLYIASNLRGQWSPHAVELKVAATAESDGPEVPIWIEMEPGASGKALVDHYKRNVLKGYKVEGIPVTRNKVVKAQPVLAGAENGRVYMLDGTWNEPFLNEFHEFPGGEKDDQIDCLSDAWNTLIGVQKLSVAWGRGAPKNPLVASGSGNNPVMGATWGQKSKKGVAKPKLERTMPDGSKRRIFLVS